MLRIERQLTNFGLGPCTIWFATVLVILALQWRPVSRYYFYKLHCRVTALLHCFPREPTPSVRLRSACCSSDGCGCRVGCCSSIPSSPVCVVCSADTARCCSLIHNELRRRAADAERAAAAHFGFELIPCNEVRPCGGQGDCAWRLDEALSMIPRGTSPRPARARARQHPRRGQARGVRTGTRGHG